MSWSPPLPYPTSSLFHRKHPSLLRPHRCLVLIKYMLRSSTLVKKISRYYNTRCWDRVIALATAAAPTSRRSGLGRPGISQAQVHRTPLRGSLRRSISTMPPRQVDTELPAHATGAAETLVKARQQENDLKLWAGWFCP